MISLLDYLKKRLILPGQEVICYDEISKWPEDEIRELEGQGYLRKIDEADGVTCDECEKACYIPVEIRKDPESGKLIGTYFCEDEEMCGPIEIELIRLHQWRINRERLFPNQTATNEKTKKEPELIKINLSNGKFKKCGSTTLLEDLIKTPDGVIIDPERYGKGQPDDLKENLRRNEHKKAAESIMKQKNIIKLKPGIRFVST